MEILIDILLGFSMFCFGYSLARRRTLNGVQSAIDKLKNELKEIDKNTGMTYCGGIGNYDPKKDK